MLLGLCLICVTCLGWAIAATAARPAGRASRQRDLDRRFRRLRHHPDRVNFLDVENLLLSGSIPAATVARTMRRAETRRMCARTMWRWADLHGTDKLVLVIDAGVGEDTLLDHLDARTAPDWRSLSIFAGLSNDTIPAGMPLEELVDLDVLPQLEDLTFPVDLRDWATTLDHDERSRFDPQPPSAGPGLQPFSPIVASSDSDGDDWTAVA